MSQFFVQGGKTIEIPGPTYDGLPNSSAITPEFCDAVFDVFDDRNRFNEVGGWPALNEALANAHGAGHVRLGRRTSTASLPVIGGVSGVEEI